MGRIWRETALGVRVTPDSGQPGLKGVAGRVLRTRSWRPYDEGSVNSGWHQGKASQKPTIPLFSSIYNCVFFQIFIMIIRP